MAWEQGYSVPPMFPKFHLIWNHGSGANQDRAYIQVGPRLGPKIQSLRSDVSFRLLFVEY